MSMNFEKPVNDEAFEEILKQFGEPVAHDRKTFLFDRMDQIHQSQLKKISKAAKQVTTVEIHGNGEIKTMSDGTRYEVTASGWKKLETV